MERCSVSLPLGMMMDALGRRELGLGRSRRGLLGPCCSDSEAEEEETDEAGDLAPFEMAGLG